MRKHKLSEEFYTELEKMFSTMSNATLQKLRDEYYYTVYRDEVDPIIKRVLLRRIKPKAKSVTG